VSGVEYEATRSHFPSGLKSIQLTLRMSFREHTLFGAIGANQSDFAVVGVDVPSVRDEVLDRRPRTDVAAHQPVPASRIQPILPRRELKHANAVLYAARVRVLL
jgi:hypothetical protein